jgi:hypothetical protein
MKDQLKVGYMWFECLKKVRKLSPSQRRGAPFRGEGTNSARYIYTRENECISEV